jgi:hypothetical protein
MRSQYDAQISASSTKRCCLLLCVAGWCSVLLYLSIGVCHDVAYKPRAPIRGPVGTGTTVTLRIGKNVAYVASGSIFALSCHYSQSSTQESTFKCMRRDAEQHHALDLSCNFISCAIEPKKQIQWLRLSIWRCFARRTTLQQDWLRAEGRDRFRSFQI